MLANEKFSTEKFPLNGKGVNVAPLIKLFLCAFKFSIMSFFSSEKLSRLTFSLFLPSLSGLQSLWTTAICSPNLQHKHQRQNPPTSSQSSDQLLQLESPLSDKGKHQESRLIDICLSSINFLSSSSFLPSLRIRFVECLN